MKASINWEKKQVSFIAESEEEVQTLLKVWEQEGMSLNSLVTKPIYALVCNLGDGTVK